MEEGGYLSLPLFIMVHFNQLTISPDNKYLIIDVSVLSETYYKDVYIDSVIIDNQDTFVSGGPSTNYIYKKDFPMQTSAITDATYGEKHIRLELTPQDLSTGTLSGLFFVYIQVTGTPAAETPCGMDTVTTLGVVTNMNPFYQQAMNYIGELSNNCSIPQNFTDYILRFKGLELAIKTGHYVDAINLFNKYFSGKEGEIPKKGGCGCVNSQ